MICITQPYAQVYIQYTYLNMHRHIYIYIHIFVNYIAPYTTLNLFKSHEIIKQFKIGCQSCRIPWPEVTHVGDAGWPKEAEVGGSN